MDICMKQWMMTILGIGTYVACFFASIYLVEYR